MRFSLLALLLLLPLAGCDLVNEKLGIEDPNKREARVDAEGRAVGSACRQSGRAIEDCYAIYSWLPKSSVYTGWRDMDAYMRENNLETVEPQLPPPEPPGRKRRREIEEALPLAKPASKSSAPTEKPNATSGTSTNPAPAQ